jgi:hypothetical protein
LVLPSGRCEGLRGRAGVRVTQGLMAVSCSTESGVVHPFG